MCDGLYLIHFQDDNALIAGIKRNVMTEESSLLWHQRLGHISIHRIKRLGNEGYSVLWTLLTLRHVWIALRESKPTNQKRVQQGVNIC